MGFLDKTIKHEDMTAVVGPSGANVKLDDGTTKHYSVDDILRLSYPAIKADMKGQPQSS
jgi:hypothetical protein